MFSLFEKMYQKITKENGVLLGWRQKLDRYEGVEFDCVVLNDYTVYLYDNVYVAEHIPTGLVYGTYATIEAALECIRAKIQQKQESNKRIEAAVDSFSTIVKANSLDERYKDVNPKKKVKKVKTMGYIENLQNKARIRTEELQTITKVLFIPIIMGQFGQVEYVNPVNTYCEFKAGGNNKEILGKVFTYDKEAGANLPFELGECIVLKTGYTIAGYSDKHSTGIYSNTVEYLSEEFEVKTHKSKVTSKSETLAYGLYKDIKADVVTSGARLHKVLYLLTDDSRIVYLSLKGEASRSVGEWLKNYNQSKVKIKLSGTEEKKKGATNYLVPIWGIGGDITEDEAEIAHSKLALLNANQPKKDEKPSLVDELLNEVDNPTETVANSDDDLPF